MFLAKCLSDCQGLIQYSLIPEHTKAPYKKVDITSLSFEICLKSTLWGLLQRKEATDLFISDRDMKTQVGVRLYNFENS